MDRDPQCWPDVLQPRRITVHCENDFCPSKLPSNKEDTDFQVLYAKFYFKCANHASLGENDESIPLNLIKSNNRKVPCLACTDIKWVYFFEAYSHLTMYFYNYHATKNIDLRYRDTVLVFPCEAAHVTCLDCFKDFCLSRLRERRFEFDGSKGYYTLPCPAACPNSLIPEIHHFHLLSPQHVSSITTIIWL